MSQAVLPQRRQRDPTGGTGGVFDKADTGLKSADKRRRFAFVQVLAQLPARCLRPGPRGRGVEVFLRT